MLAELLQSVSGHPDREALLDALVCNCHSTASDILLANASHEDLLDDKFLAPFLIEAVHQRAWRVLDAFTEYGYGPWTLLKTSPDDEGLSIGDFVAMSSVEQVKAFRACAFARDWDPLEGHGMCCPASYGLLFGPSATFKYWKNEIKSLAAREPSLVAPLARRVLTMAYQVKTREPDIEKQRRATERWESLVAEFVPMDGLSPFGDAFRQMRPMRHFCGGGRLALSGEASLIALLGHVRRTTSSPDEQVLEMALEDKDWYQVKMLIRADWPLTSAQVGDAVRQLLLHLKAPLARDWLDAWDALRDAMERLPASESAAALEHVPALCRDAHGRPMLSSDLERERMGHETKGLAWERAVHAAVELPSATRGPRLAHRF